MTEELEASFAVNPPALISVGIGKAPVEKDVRTEATKSINPTVDTMEDSRNDDREDARKSMPPPLPRQNQREGVSSFRFENVNSSRSTYDMEQLKTEGRPRVVPVTLRRSSHSITEVSKSTHGVQSSVELCLPDEPVPTDELMADVEGLMVGMKDAINMGVGGALDHDDNSDMKQSNNSNPGGMCSFMHLTRSEERANIVAESVTILASNSLIAADNAHTDKPPSDDLVGCVFEKIVDLDCFSQCKNKNTDQSSPETSNGEAVHDSDFMPQIIKEMAAQRSLNTEQLMKSLPELGACRAPNFKVKVDPHGNTATGPVNNVSETVIRTPRTRNAHSTEEKRTLPFVLKSNDEEDEGVATGALAGEIAYTLTRTLAEGWLYKLGTGAGWFGHRDWKHRFVRLSLARFDGYENQVPLLMTYWYETSTLPSSVIALDSAEVIAIDEKDETQWDTYCFQVAHTSLSAEVTSKRVNRTFTVETKEARDLWVREITKALTQSKPIPSEPISKGLGPIARRQGVSYREMKSMPSDETSISSSKVSTTVEIDTPNINQETSGTKALTMSPSLKESKNKGRENTVAASPLTDASRGGMRMEERLAANARDIEITSYSDDSTISQKHSSELEQLLTFSPTEEERIIASLTVASSTFQKASGTEKAPEEILVRKTQVERDGQDLKEYNHNELVPKEVQTSNNEFDAAIESVKKQQHHQGGEFGKGTTKSMLLLEAECPFPLNSEIIIASDTCDGEENKAIVKLSRDERSGLKDEKTKIGTKDKIQRESLELEGIREAANILDKGGLGQAVVSPKAEEVESTLLSTNSTGDKETATTTDHRDDNFVTVRNTGGIQKCQRDASTPNGLAVDSTVPTEQQTIAEDETCRELPTIKSPIKDDVGNALEIAVSHDSSRQRNNITYNLDQTQSEQMSLQQPSTPNEMVSNAIVDDDTIDVASSSRFYQAEVAYTYVKTVQPIETVVSESLSTQDASMLDSPLEENAAAKQKTITENKTSIKLLHCESPEEDRGEAMATVVSHEIVDRTQSETKATSSNEIVVKNVTNHNADDDAPYLTMDPEDVEYGSGKRTEDFKTSSSGRQRDQHEASIPNSLVEDTTMAFQLLTAAEEEAQTGFYDDQSSTEEKSGDAGILAVDVSVKTVSRNRSKDTIAIESQESLFGDKVTQNRSDTATARTIETIAEAVGNVNTYKDTSAELMIWEGVTGTTKLNNSAMGNTQSSENNISMPGGHPELTSMATEKSAESNVCYEKESNERNDGENVLSENEFEDMRVSCNCSQQPENIFQRDSETTESKRTVANAVAIDENTNGNSLQTENVEVIQPSPMESMGGKEIKAEIAEGTSSNIEIQSNNTSSSDVATDRECKASDKAALAAGALEESFQVLHPNPAAKNNDLKHIPHSPVLNLPIDTPIYIEEKGTGSHNEAEPAGSTKPCRDCSAQADSASEAKTAAEVVKAGLEQFFPSDEDMGMPESNGDRYDDVITPAEAEQLTGDGSNYSDKGDENKVSATEVQKDGSVSCNAQSDSASKAETAAEVVKAGIEQIVPFNENMVMPESNEDRYDDVITPADAEQLTGDSLNTNNKGVENKVFMTEVQKDGHVSIISRPEGDHIGEKDAACDQSIKNTLNMVLGYCFEETTPNSVSKKSTVEPDPSPQRIPAAQADNDPTPEESTMVVGNDMDRNSTILALRGNGKSVKSDDNASSTSSLGMLQPLTPLLSQCFDFPQTVQKEDATQSARSNEKKSEIGRDLNIERESADAEEHIQATQLIGNSLTDATDAVLSCTSAPVIIPPIDTGLIEDSVVSERTFEHTDGSMLDDETVTKAIFSHIHPSTIEEATENESEISTPINFKNDEMAFGAMKMKSGHVLEDLDNKKRDKEELSICDPVVRDITDCSDLSDVEREEEASGADGHRDTISEMAMQHEPSQNENTNEEQLHELKSASGCIVEQFGAKCSDLSIPPDPNDTVVRREADEQQTNAEHETVTMFPSTEPQSGSRYNYNNWGNVSIESAIEIVLGFNCFQHEIDATVEEMDIMQCTSKADANSLSEMVPRESGTLEGSSLSGHKGTVEHDIEHTTDGCEITFKVNEENAFALDSDGDKKMGPKIQPARSTNEAENNLHPPVITSTQKKAEDNKSPHPKDDETPEDMKEEKAAKERSGGNKCDRDHIHYSTFFFGGYKESVAEHLGEPTITKSEVEATLSLETVSISIPERRGGVSENDSEQVLSVSEITSRARKGDTADCTDGVDSSLLTGFSPNADDNSKNLIGGMSVEHKLDGNENPPYNPALSIENLNESVDYLLEEKVIVDCSNGKAYEAVENEIELVAFVSNSASENNEGNAPVPAEGEEAHMSSTLLPNKIENNMSHSEEVVPTENKMAGNEDFHFFSVTSISKGSKHAEDLKDEKIKDGSDESGVHNTHNHESMSVCESGITMNDTNSSCCQLMSPGTDPEVLLTEKPMVANDLNATDDTSVIIKGRRTTNNVDVVKAAAYAGTSDNTSISEDRMEVLTEQQLTTENVSEAEPINAVNENRSRAIEAMMERFLIEIEKMCNTESASKNKADESIDTSFNINKETHSGDHDDEETRNNDSQAAVGIISAAVMAENKKPPMVENGVETNKIIPSIFHMLSVWFVLQKVGAVENATKKETKEENEMNHNDGKSGFEENVDTRKPMSDGQQAATDKARATSIFDLEEQLSGPAALTSRTSTACGDDCSDDDSDGDSVDGFDDVDDDSEGCAYVGCNDCNANAQEQPEPSLLGHARQNYYTNNDNLSVVSIVETEITIGMDN